MAATGVGSLAAGCGAGDDNAGDSSSAGGELSIMFWGEGNQNELQLELIELYEQQADGVTFSAEYSGLEGYYDKLATRVAGGNPADIFGIHDVSLAEYAARGAVRNIEEFRAEPLGLDSVANESVVEGCLIGGELHFVPLGVSTEPGFIYDKTVLEQAGLALPSDEWTLAEYRELAQAVAQSGVRTAGTADLGGVPPALGAWLRTHELSLLSSGGLGFDVDDLAEWFNFWDELRREGSAVPIEVTAAAVGFQNDPVVTADAALTTTAKDKGWLALDGLTDDELVLVPFPRAAADAPAATQIVPGAWFAVSAESEKVDAAIDFLSYHISNMDALRTIGIGRHGVPLFEEAREELYPEAKPAHQKIYDLLATVEASQTGAVDVVYPVGANELFQQLKPLNEQIGFGQSGVSDAAESFFDTAERILEG
ncbi:ABC transporter substrate-binding protein [Jiangella asiatica]|uniref:ABC transporter substrate-binding protein n=1 Tax=Jiangella asiatica TaxID=2530372 RepID=UPI0013A5D36A|nr:ABC transporter substrate-binding protein [Jiangella asiatica]